MSGKPNGNGPEARETVALGLPDVYVSVGAHIAHLFRGEEERLTVLAPFVHSGLEAGDLCLLVAEAAALPRIRERLATLGSDTEEALRSGQLLVSEGGASKEELTKTFEDAMTVAKRDGRELIRIGGDMTWALGKMSSTAKLLEWEAFYDKTVGHRAGFVALCQYDYSRFDGSAIMCALQTHPLSMVGDIVQENSFYRDPDEVLNELSRTSA